MSKCILCGMPITSKSRVICYNCWCNKHTEGYEQYKKYVTISEDDLKQQMNNAVQTVLGMIIADLEELEPEYSTLSWEEGVGDSINIVEGYLKGAQRDK